jgi:FkbM family methyltransferase
MSKTYYYFNDEKYPIKVTQETCELTPHTFHKDILLYENQSLAEFFNDISGYTSQQDGIKTENKSLADFFNDISGYTFEKDGIMTENKSLAQFFKGIDKYKKVNIVDIGAQSGLYSLYAKYLPFSTFYSFEPFPTSFKLLQDNLALNKLTNVKTYNVALSDTEGTLTLNTSESHNGLHTIGKNPIRFSDIKPIQVESTTLDNMFFKKDIPVHYIKIDTEGAEYFILKGGEETIKKYKPVIQLEWNYINMEQCDVTKEMMEELIKNFGYKEISFVEEEKLIGPE